MAATGDALPGFAEDCGIEVRRFFDVIHRNDDAVELHRGTSLGYLRPSGRRCSIVVVTLWLLSQFETVALAVHKRRLSNRHAAGGLAQFDEATTIGFNRALYLLDVIHLQIETGMG